MGNADTTLLIKSILSNETTLSPKANKNGPKGSLNRSLKKRKNSNIGNAVFNLTGNFTRKASKVNYNSKRKLEFSSYYFRMLCKA